VLENALTGPYLVSGRFGVADILVGSMLVWGAAMGLLEGRPRLAEYAARIRSRPAFGRS
jgi:glutathione S-transferase